MKQITIYVDQDVHAEITSMMAIKNRSLTFIANELMKQAIKEKKRKKKVEKQDIQI